MRTNAFVALAAAFALALGAQQSNAAEWKIKDVKVHGDATKGHVEVEFHYEFIPDAPGDIVFLSVGAGQDHAHEMAKGTGTLKGTFKGKLDTHKSVESLKDTRGGKPIPIVVYACEVYDLKQAHAWIANHAAKERRIHTIELK